MKQKQVKGMVRRWPMPGEVLGSADRQATEAGIPGASDNVTRPPARCHELVRAGDEICKRRDLATELAQITRAFQKTKGRRGARSCRHLAPGVSRAVERYGSSRQGPPPNGGIFFFFFFLFGIPDSVTLRT